MEVARAEWRDRATSLRSRVSKPSRPCEESVVGPGEAREGARSTAADRAQSRSA